jgi:hypothetical protein
MSKAHHNAGPTFRPGTMKVPRGPAPCPIRQQVELDDMARQAAHERQFDKLKNEIGLCKALIASGHLKIGK